MAIVIAGVGPGQAGRTGHGLLQSGTVGGLRHSENRRNAPGQGEAREQARGRQFQKRSPGRWLRQGRGKRGAKHIQPVARLGVQHPGRAHQVYQRRPIKPPGRLNTGIQKDQDRTRTLPIRVDHHADRTGPGQSAQQMLHGRAGRLSRICLLGKRLRRCRRRQVAHAEADQPHR